MKTPKLYILAFALLASSLCKAQWSLSGNSISGTNFIGTTNNEPLIIQTNSHQAMVILANGNVGIGTTNPHYTLQVVGDIVDSGSFYANYISTANGISVGQFRLVNGLIDSIVSTSGLLQLSATIVNADGALNAAGSLTAGVSDTAITINGHTGTITNTLKKIGFGTDTIVTTGAMKAGTMAVGTTYIPSGYALAVDGTIIATDIYVELFSSWPDYVFEKKYKHRSLEELETYLNINHHFPGLPSAKEIQEKGSFPLGEIVTQNTKEIEELALYIIELDKKVKALEEDNKKLLEEIKKK